jgi:glycosyltransferase involved in cell wall biosynthesis
MTPRVTVVVPTYNNADYVRATIDSILGQQYEDFELLVADHSSTDGTWDILQDYQNDPRVRLSRTDAGGGARRNWNAVSESAVGEFIKLVCGDDLLYPHALATQVAALADAGTEAVLAASQRDLIDARGAVFVRARGLGSLDGLVDGSSALRATVRAGGNLFGEPACVLMRTDALRRAGWWQDLRYYIDVGSYAHVLVQGKAVALRQAAAAFRVSASQWSVALMREQAREAAEFHRLAQGLAPMTISDGDVRRGDRMAKVAATQRRLAYLALGRRMQPNTSDSTPTR